MPDFLPFVRDLFDCAIRAQDMIIRGSFYEESSGCYCPLTALALRISPRLPMVADLVERTIIAEYPGCNQDFLSGFMQGFDENDEYSAWYPGNALAFTAGARLGRWLAWYLFGGQSPGVV